MFYIFFQKRRKSYKTSVYIQHIIYVYIYIHIEHIEHIEQ